MKWNTTASGITQYTMREKGKTMTREEAQKILTMWMASGRSADGQRGYIEGWFDKDDVEAFRMAIKALSADIQKVESATIHNEGITFYYQKTGEWINREKCQVDEDAYEVATCSECGVEITIEYPYDNYCPNCGAKMNKMKADDKYGQ